jgi:ABC-type Fe3+-hydroxamate transport system substrate-binding protein
VVDDAGTTVTLAAPPRRVVSLVPAATELVFALGAGDRLVGRTKWCDYPSTVAAVPSVGDGLNPNVEAIVATNPDLVLSYRSSSNAQSVARLRALAIPVVELAIDRFADFERDGRLLARALGIASTGDSLVAAVRADLESATVTNPAPPAVLIVAWPDPPMTIGGGSYLDEILRRAGARNLFGDSSQPSFVVSLEAIVARRPDRVLVVGENDPDFAARGEWQVVPAIRDRRFVRVSGSMFNRPSPRIGAAVRALAAALGEQPR